MNPSNQAVIAIRRPANWVGASLRSFVVRIDGRRAGRIKRGTTGEFTVEPGEHTVEVSMDWFRSRPFRVVVEPGSRTDLAIGSRSGGALKSFLPMVLAALAAPVLVEGLRAVVSPVDDNRLLRSALFLVAFGVLYGGYVLLTSWFASDYWALFVLEPAGTGSPLKPVVG
jgi:hypothetical protein